MTNKPNIAVVITSVRENRFGDKAGQWIFNLAKQRTDAEFELVDLKDYNLPIFTAAVSPAYAPNPDPAGQRWGKKLSEFDGYLFVVAEYNRSITGAFKNALDHVYNELNRKTAAYFGYGSVGGARAVEQLRNMSVEFQMAPVRHGVHFGGPDFYSVVMGGGKTLEDFPYLLGDAKNLLDNLVWWTNATKSAREASVQAQAAE